MYKIRNKAFETEAQLTFVASLPGWAGGALLGQHLHIVEDDLPPTRHSRYNITLDINI